MDYKEEDYLMLSGIQHFAFCRRQWALIHMEQQWDENLRTVEGNLFHKKAHDGHSSEKRKNIIISRGMPVFSREMGVSGICDIVEFHRDDMRGIALQGLAGNYLVCPVEYKKGEPKENDADALQLTAQAMCLEEMLSCSIDKGYLYYGEIRHRIEVVLDEKLRQQVRDSFSSDQKYCFFLSSTLPQTSPETLARNRPEEERKESAIFLLAHAPIRAGLAPVKP